MKGKFVLILGLIALTLLSACKKELDFGNGQVYSVRELNNGCKVRCGKDPYWENEIIGARGSYNPNYGAITFAANDNDKSYVTISDLDEPGIIMTIEVTRPDNDASKRNDVLRYIEDHPYQICTITGTGGVEEHPMNFSCEKVLKLMISDTSAVEFP